MAKRESHLESLRKAAKKRQNRMSALAIPNQQVVSTGPNSTGREDGHTGAPANTAADLAALNVTPSKSTQTLDALIRALLMLDRSRDDLTDRSLVAGLRSVLRGYPPGNESAAAVYQAIVGAREAENLDAYRMRAAIDELLEIVNSYGSDRQTPRAAFTYLHSITA